MLYVLFIQCNPGKIQKNYVIHCSGANNVNFPLVSSIFGGVVCSFYRLNLEEDTI